MQTSEALAEYIPIIQQYARSYWRVGCTDDATQEGLIAAFLALEEYDPSRGVPLKPYILQRAKWAIIDFLRKESAWDKQLLPLIPPEDCEDAEVQIVDHAAITPEDALLEAQSARAIRSAIERLPKAEADVIRKRFYLDQTCRQINEPYKRNASRVSQITTSALGRLRSDKRLRDELLGISGK